MPILRALNTVFLWTEGLYPTPPEVAFPNSVIIPFNIQMQEMDRWCWAAVASSVSFYFDHSSQWDQVEIVASALGFDDEADPDETWDIAHQIDASLEVVGCFADWSNGQESFSRIFRELDCKRPVCVEIHWTGGMGHAVVVNGCWLDENNFKYYRVCDPYHFVDCLEFPAYRDISEKQLSKCLNEGRWAKTFFVMPPIDLAFD